MTPRGTIADVTETEESSDHPDREDKYAWFRLHLKLSPNHGPIALLIELPVTQSTLDEYHAIPVPARTCLPTAS